EAELQSRLASLEKVAGELADQRLQLVERYQRVVQAQLDWQQERERTVSDLEALGLRLQEREGTLVSREQAVSTTALGLRPPQEEVAHCQRHLDAWQARLTLRQAAWEGERARLLAEVRTRRNLADSEQPQDVSPHAQRALYERQIQELHDEVERLVKLLLDQS